MNNIVGLGHVALKVKDIDASMAFYNKGLGLPEMLRLHHDDGSLFLIYLRVTDTEYLELFPNGQGNGVSGLDEVGAHHFCLTVVNMEETVAELKLRDILFVAFTETGLNPVDEPVIGNGLDGNRQCWIRDPDGNRIELMEMADDCLQYKGLRRLAAVMA